MAKIMLVNMTHVEESRVAILEDGILEQYEIETINRTNIKGQIHNAVVENVHPSLEAAFLKIGPDLKGFLPLDEVNFKLLPARSETRARGKIGQHLHPGQKLMVQVIREPFAGKPPTVTTYFSLPGRYLVLMPGVDSAGISRKIESAEQRDHLKKIIDELKPPEGFGLIVRTAGVDQSKPELMRDLRYLLRLWESTQRASRSTDFPGLVYRERDLVIRTIRDYFTPDISEVWIDNAESYDRALDFVRDVMPTKAKILKLYTGDRPLFSKFNLEEQIDSIYKRRVSLPSGGEITIDGTEALTAIDVNSARSSRQGDAEENAAQTNTEAATEIARQLRLRDLGGLVVIDFIDMMASRNQKRVEKAMRDAMRADKAKYDVTRISKLGLMEVSRQRIKGEKMRASYATCPACEGYGLIKNVEAAALASLRKLQTRCLRGDFGRIRMGLPPEVANWVLNHKREDLIQLERRQNVRIQVDPKASLLRHECEFEFFPREKTEEPPPPLGYRSPLPTPPDLKEVEAMQEPVALVIPTVESTVSLPSTSAGDPRAVGAPAAADAVATPGRKRRRRRRRSRGAGASGPEAPLPTVPEIAVRESPSTSPPSGDDASEAARDEADENESGEMGEPLLANDDEDGSPAGAAEGDSTGRRRRRRRRRRRGRGGGATVQDAPETVATAESDAPFPEKSPARVEDELVPRGIRAEELLPAATGSAERAASGRRSRSASRRKRSGRRSSGPSHAPAPLAIGSEHSPPPDDQEE